MSEKRIIPHLLEEPPISLYPSLAVALGNVNKAIILQQVHYLLQSAKLSKNAYVFVDDKWWVYNSYKEWRKYFPWLAEVTIKGLFGMLEHDGIIISQQGVKDKLDRRKWYTIDYDAYLSHISCIGQNLSDEHEIKNIPSDGQNLSDVNKESENSNSEKESKTRASADVSNIAKLGSDKLDTYYHQHEAILDELLLLTGIDTQFVHWGEMELTQRRAYIRAVELYLSKGIVYHEYTAWLTKELIWRKPLRITLKDFTDNIPRYRTAVKSNITPLETEVKEIDLTGWTIPEWNPDKEYNS